MKRTMIVLFALAIATTNLCAQWIYDSTYHSIIKPRYSTNKLWFYDAPFIGYPTITDTGATKQFVRSSIPIDNQNWINVKDYGAVGDSTTDDFGAIGSAVSAIPSSGGVLYFPPGKYRTSAGFVLDNPTTILGCGMGNFTDDAVTQICLDSPTDSLFTVKANSARFQNISLRCVAGTTPSSGGGIITAGTYIEQKVDYQDVSVYGFWIDIDVQVGAQWTANNIFILNPVKYGMKIRNTVNPDAGDWSITNSNFNAVDYDADAALRIEGSGGGKISNIKVNMGYPANKRFGYGVDLSSAVSTIILHVTNASIENFRIDGIRVNVTAGSYRHLFFSNIGIGVPVDASGVGISLASFSLGALENISITDCIFYGKTTGYAIIFDSVNRAYISGCVNQTFPVLFHQTGCTNIIVDSGGTGSSFVAHVSGQPTIPDSLRLIPGSNVSITQSGHTVTIAASSGGTGGDSTYWFNVKHYGAKGDGIVNDSVAISLAVTALNSVGGGTLYFPPGTYLTSGGFDINYPFTILGCGMGNFNSVNGVSQINFSSGTDTLFNVKANVGRFHNIALLSTFSGTPSTSAGIATTGSYLEQKIDYDGISVSGFYTDIVVDVGAQWTANNIFILNPVKYGMKIRNLVNPDAGDWSITNSNFNAEEYAPDAAIRIEGGGGGKISNIKINMSPPGNTGKYSDGIDLTCASTTILFFVQNSSIENFTANGINVNITANTYRHLIFSGLNIGIAGYTTGYAMNFNSHTLGTLENIVISGCSFYGGNGNYATSFTNVNNVYMTGSMLAQNTVTPDNFTGLINQSNCSNITVDSIGGGGSTGGGGGVGGFDSYTKLLMHMNGANGGSYFKDETGKTVTPNGSVATSDTASEFGSGSASFASAGNYLTLADHADWNFGNGDFTIDFWIYFNSVSATYNGIMQQYQDGNNKWTLMYASANHWLTFGEYLSGDILQCVWSWTPEANHWYHVAIVRSGITDWKAYVNGVALTLYQAIVGPTTVLSDLTGTLNIGQVDNSTSERLDGYIDELRISKGIARWLANFTPPTQPY